MLVPLVSFALGVVAARFLPRGAQQDATPPQASGGGGSTTSAKRVVIDDEAPVRRAAALRGSGRKARRSSLGSAGLALSTPAEEISDKLTRLSRGNNLSERQQAELSELSDLLASDINLHSPKFSPADGPTGGYSGNGGGSAGEVLDSSTKEWLSSDYRVSEQTLQADAESQRLNSKRMLSKSRLGGPDSPRRGRNSLTNDLPAPQGVSPGVQALLKDRDEWTFDIFKFAEADQQRGLAAMGMALLADHGCIERFKINSDALLRFLRHIEGGYCKVPYHNSIHATDVLQTLNFLISRGGMQEWMTDIEIFAILITCIIHDFEHPGLNNNYLIAVEHELALLYNDKNVLENHHVAQSMRLMQQPGMDILSGMTADERKQFRKLVIEMVLVTDMAVHFTFLASFKRKLGVGINVNDPEDRLDVFRMAIKVADVSNPAKPIASACRWTDCVMAEFFAQGDKERQRGLTISPLCDRNNTNIPKSQVDFVDFIVNPIYAAFAEYLPIVQEVCIPHLEATREYWSAKHVEEQQKNASK